MKTKNIVIPAIDLNYIKNIAYGKKDEALVISNDDDILVLRLKQAGALIEIDYSENGFFEEKFRNILRTFTEDDIVYVRIRKAHGRITEALPSQIFLTYEYQASNDACEKIQKVIDGLEEVLRVGGLNKEVQEELKEELKHAINNFRKFNRRKTRAKKLLERYEQEKPTKVKRSFRKKLTPYHQKLNNKKTSDTTPRIA